MDNTSQQVLVREGWKENRMVIREMELSCLEDIKPIFREVFSQSPWNEDWSDERQLNEYLLDLTVVRNVLIYGLYEKEELIGVSIGRIKHWCRGTEYYIEELFIRNGFQGRGCGRAFFSLIEKELEKRDIHQIYLMTDRNQPAHGFYQTIGFTELPELTSFFKEF